MFEDATFESTGKIHTRSRTWMLATFTFNGSILLALILISLVYPEALPHRLMNILLTAPPAPQAPRPQEPLRTRAQAFHGVPQFDGRQLVAPRVIPISIARMDRTEEGPGDRLITMDTGDRGGVPGGGAFEHAPAPQVRAAPKPSGPVHISSGVAAGMLIEKVMPVYPAIAKVTHTEGTVELQATIAKNGTIENLRVLSGPAMLQQASIDAVRHWRYRPFLLNGEPVAVETTVKVIFSLGE